MYLARSSPTVLTWFMDASLSGLQRPHSGTPRPPGASTPSQPEPQPLRPEIGWQVRWLRRGQVRIVGATSPSGVAFPLPRAACRNRLQNGRQIRVRAKALGENGKAVAAYTGALAAGEAHHYERIVP